MEKETENDKKIALVTGGSRGIGAAIAEVTRAASGCGWISCNCKL